VALGLVGGFHHNHPGYHHKIGRDSSRLAGPAHTAALGHHTVVLGHHVVVDDDRVAADRINSRLVGLVHTRSEKLEFDTDSVPVDHIRSVGLADALAVQSHQALVVGRTDVVAETSSLTQIGRRHVGRQNCIGHLEVGLLRSLLGLKELLHRTVGRAVAALAQNMKKNPVHIDPVLVALGNRRSPRSGHVASGHNVTSVEDCSCLRRVAGLEADIGQTGLCHYMSRSVR